MNITNRRRWIRAPGLGLLGAIVLAAGCSIGSESASRPLLPDSNRARDEAIRQKARSDSLPAAQPTERQVSRVEG
jgi:hypothetical protein